MIVVSTVNDYSQLRWLTLGLITECNNDYYCFTYKNSGTYSGSQYNQDNPVLSALKNNSSNKFHLAYQENEQIKYDDITLGSNYGLLNISPLTLSTGSGYLYNRYPSLIVMNNNYARVTWQGTRYEEEEAEWGKIKKEDNQSGSEETEITRIVFKSSDYNYFWSFGNNTGKPNINRHSVGYAFAWSENSGSQVKTVNNTLNHANIKTLTGLSGEGVQMTNGSSINDMFVVSLNINLAPYYFMRSNSLGSYGLNKEEALSISSGREGVVYNEGAEFYFAIGDIKVNGNNADFVEIPDSVKTINLSLINEYLKSQTMSVDNASQLLYSVQYGMIDSASTKNYLQTGKTITFGVELVDAITNNVLGRYDEVTFDENNMFSYDKLGYEVSLEGIGTNREVYLRLTTTSNDETSGYSLTQRYSDETILGKTSTKKINYTGTEKPTEYALFQNYPNPFNPVTTITYQIPKEGLVTLKIYDILGKEVTTLINEEKQAGKYSIEFNASKLSSGVYFYELRFNEPKPTKKYC